MTIYLLMEDTDQTIHSQHDPKAYVETEEEAREWVAEIDDPDEPFYKRRRMYMALKEKGEYEHDVSKPSNLGDTTGSDGRWR